MTHLVDKIFALYPELDGKNLMLLGILVVDNNDGTEPFIAEWNHPTLPKPTDAQLNEVTK